MGDSLKKIWALGIIALAFAMPGKAQTVAIPDSYVINIGDEIELDILDDSDPPQRFSVGRDGEVRLPFIGGVNVATMSVRDARDLVRATYMEREIFVNPTVELSIAGFRPIAVLGDVRTPGNFDFQPFLTAEQAVGLAGGPAISSNNEEARVLERRTLAGTLSNLEFDLALSAAHFARVQAQLAGSSSLSWTRVPPELRPAINREQFDEHKQEEDQIIALARADADTRRALLSDAVTEAERRISLLERRQGVQADILAAAETELDRSRKIIERGLAPRADLNIAQRAAAVAQGDLLALQEQRSAALIQLTDLKANLSRFDSEREQALRAESQSVLNEIHKQIANRASIEDRIRLLDQWMNAAAGMQTELLIRYSVRRRRDDGIETIILAPYDELLPGDLLVIAVIPPESIQEPG